MSRSVFADIAKLCKSGLSVRETSRDIAFVSLDELTTDDFFHPASTSDTEQSRSYFQPDRKRESRRPPDKIRLPATLVVCESSESTHA
jgi:hypothetical protein